jgi:hypothetical protein
MTLPNEPQTETPEAREARLEAEAQTSGIAAAIKAMMPPGHVFVLVTASVGAGGHSSYASTATRDDACRLLNELLDTWQYGHGLMAEPTTKTAAFLREQVRKLMIADGDEGPVKAGPLFRAMEGCLGRAKEAMIAGNGHELLTQVMACVTYGIAIYQSCQQFMHDHQAKRAEGAGS